MRLKQKPLFKTQQKGCGLLWCLTADPMNWEQVPSTLYLGTLQSLLEVLCIL